MDLQEAIRKAEQAEARAGDLEKQVAALTADRDKATTALLAIEAQTVARDALKGAKLPEVTIDRITMQAASTFTVKDGKLDETALRESVKAAMKDEAEYLVKVLGKGTVVGLGESGDGSGGSDDTPTALAEAEKELDAAFRRIGLGEKQAAHAVQGR